MIQIVPDAWDIFAFLLKARLPSDSLQNGIVNKSPLPEIFYFRDQNGEIWCNVIG